MLASMPFDQGELLLEQELLMRPHASTQGALELQLLVLHPTPAPAAPVLSDPSSPLASSANMARPDTPITLVATAANLMLAPSSVFCRRLVT
jgi:hypothetical protein